MAARATQDEISAERERIIRDRILDATRQVTAEKGFYEPEIADIIELAEVSRSTFYRYFPNGKAQAIRAVTEQFTAETIQAIISLAPVDDGAERLVQWIKYGFGQVDRYGMMSVQIAAGNIPHYLKDILDITPLYQFIGRIVKDCQAQGHCRENLDRRHVVHTFFALVHPDHFRRRRGEGKNPEEILRETLEVFFAAFASEEALSSPLFQRLLETL